MNFGRPRATLHLESLEDRWTPSTATTDTIALGVGAGGVPEVRILNLDGSLRRSFLAYDASFRGGARVAVGDLNGDGVAEIVTAPGVGGGPNIRVFDGATGNLTHSFFAYDPRFLGGVSVAVGVLEGRPVIVTGAGFGGGPHVKIFSPTGQELSGFMAYASNFTGGVTVAVGDVLGNGRGAIITGAGPGGGPQLNVFDSGGNLRYSTFAYNSNFRNGITVAAGDVGGIGRDVIVTGPGPGGGPHVNIIDPLSGQVLQAFFAYSENFRGGVDVSVVPGQGGRDLLVTAPGPGGGPDVRVFQVPVPATTIIQQPVFSPMWGSWFTPLAFGTPFLLSNFWGYQPFFTGGMNFGFGFGMWQPYLTPYWMEFAPLANFWPTAAPALNWVDPMIPWFWDSYIDPVYVDPDPFVAPNGWFFDDTLGEWYYDDSWFDFGSFDTGYFSSGFDDWGWYDTGWDYGWDDWGWGSDWYDTGWDYGWDDWGWDYGWDDWGLDDWGGWW